MPMRTNISREYLRHNKEHILDLIQHLTDVVRYADRKPDAPNSDYYKSYLQMSFNIWYNLFM